MRREILELALYTFKYVGGVQNVDRVHAADDRVDAEVRRLPPEERLSATS